MRIVTGSQEGAGTTDTDVYITLTGDKGSSGKVGISSWLKALKGSHQQQTFDDLIIESDGDLGRVLVVALGNEKEWLADMGAPWYVDFVMVHNFQSSLNEEFPVYHWIGDGDYVTCTAHTSECIVVQWNLSNTTIIGTTYVCPEYGGSRISGASG